MEQAAAADRAAADAAGFDVLFVVDPARSWYANFGPALYTSLPIRGRPRSRLARPFRPLSPFLFLFA